MSDPVCPLSNRAYEVPLNLSSTIGLKRCPDRGESKPDGQCPRNKNYRDGPHPFCKVCHNARGKESKQRLYEEQGGVCAICGAADPEHVDHSHETGDVRGILCFNCNGGLGQFKDSTDALRNAVRYLEGRDPEAREVNALAVVRAGELRRTSV